MLNRGTSELASFEATFHVYATWQHLPRNASHRWRSRFGEEKKRFFLLHQEGRIYFEDIFDIDVIESTCLNRLVYFDVY